MVRRTANHLTRAATSGAVVVFAVIITAACGREVERMSLAN
jgi:hypothetical protein